MVLSGIQILFDFEKNGLKLSRIHVGKVRKQVRAEAYFWKE